MSKLTGASFSHTGGPGGDEGDWEEVPFEDALEMEGYGKWRECDDHSHYDYDEPGQRYYHCTYPCLRCDGPGYAFGARRESKHEV